MLSPRFAPLEDALYFCSQAGAQVSSFGEMERFARVSILLSWMGLEEAVKSSVKALQQAGYIEERCRLSFLTESDLWRSFWTEHAPTKNNLLISDA